MRTPPVFVEAGISVHDALARLASERISAVYVAPDTVSGDVKAAEAGIVTERDVLRAIARFGAAALDLPVGQIMSQPLAAVPADAFVYRAIGRMNRLKTRHLGVVDEAGQVIGALSRGACSACAPGRPFRSARRWTMRRTRMPWRLPGRSCRGSPNRCWRKDCPAATLRK